MNRHRNKKTGAYLETECEFSGENWEKVSEEEKQQPEQEPEPEKGSKKK